MFLLEPLNMAQIPGSQKKSLSLKTSMAAHASAAAFGSLGWWIIVQQSCYSGVPSDLKLPYRYMYDATGPKLDQQVQQAAQRQNPEVRLQTKSPAWDCCVLAETETGIHLAIPNATVQLAGCTNRTVVRTMVKPGGDFM